MWDAPPAERQQGAKILYRGPLAGSGGSLALHAGYDGWQDPRDIPMSRLDDATWVAQIDETDGRTVLDCVVRDGDEDVRYDNNDGADYRLWIHLDPVDSHVHARARGASEFMSFESLRSAFFSSGMTHALISWQDNGFVDSVTADVPWLSKLVWVRPGHTNEEELRRRLSDGAVGLKLHPAYDGYPGNTTELDPYLTAANEANVPVCIHSSPGHSDPMLLQDLAERFPELPIVLYHTYLGPHEGRIRAAHLTQLRSNLYLETSWCRSETVEQLIGIVGPERVLFGSDAATDGPFHFTRQPPNIEMCENYNGGLLALSQRMGPDVMRMVLEDNARRLFRLGPADE